MAQMRRAKTVVATVVDATRKGRRYLSGLIRANGRQETMKMKKATKSEVCIVPPANSVSKFAKDGHRAVKNTFKHLPPYQVFVAVQTNERNTRTAIGNR